MDLYLTKDQIRQLRDDTSGEIIWYNIVAAKIQRETDDNFCNDLPPVAKYHNMRIFFKKDAQE